MFGACIVLTADDKTCIFKSITLKEQVTTGKRSKHRGIEMADWLLLGAAGISLFGAFFHGVVGGRMYMENINASGLDDLGKSLSLVSWHMFTIFLLIGGLAFVCVVYASFLAVTVYWIIAINALGALLFVLLGLGGHRSLLKMPGALLMGATAVLGYLGIA